eukprot:jgi/Chlat1/7601/Chrsp64S07094
MAEMIRQMLGAMIFEIINAVRTTPTTFPSYSLPPPPPPQFAIPNPAGAQYGSPPPPPPVNNLPAPAPHVDPEDEQMLSRAHGEASQRTTHTSTIVPTSC